MKEIFASSRHNFIEVPKGLEGWRLFGRLRDDNALCSADLIVANQSFVGLIDPGYGKYLKENWRFGSSQEHELRSAGGGAGWCSCNSSVGPGKGHVL